MNRFIATHHQLNYYAAIIRDAFKVYYENVSHFYLIHSFLRNYAVLLCFPQSSRTTILDSFSVMSTPPSRSEFTV